mgnify:CR=1 FL=1
MSGPHGTRRWSDLPEADRVRLLADYQPILDTAPPTCSFDTKLERFRAFLSASGVSIDEHEVRGPSRRA